MFVTQAASFRPRVIVLIVPPAVSTPKGYQVMYEEQETMKDKCGSVTLSLGFIVRDLILLILLYL